MFVDPCNPAIAQPRNRETALLQLRHLHQQRQAGLVAADGYVAAAYSGVFAVAVDVFLRPFDEVPVAEVFDEGAVGVSGGDVGEVEDEIDCSARR